MKYLYVRIFWKKKTLYQYGLIEKYALPELASYVFPFFDFLEGSIKRDR